MNFIEIVKRRKSIRSFAPNKNIDSAKLESILEAGRLAPSAKNIQEWKFVVVKEKALIKKFIEVCKGQQFVGEASALIVGCADKIDYVMTCGQPAYTVDLAIALEHMVLMATELNIGSCWLGAFYEDKVKELLAIPSNVRVVGMIALGESLHPIEGVVTTGRKELKEIVCYDKWRF